MRRQETKEQLVYYTELERRGLTGMLPKDTDPLQLLRQRGFISVELHRGRRFDYDLATELEHEGIEYQVKSLGPDESNPCPRLEFSLPHFVDDRVLLPDGHRVEREVRPSKRLTRQRYFGKYSDVIKVNPSLHTDQSIAQLQMIRGHGFIVWRGSIPFRSIDQFVRQGIEFAMRGYFGGDTVVYEVQLHGFIDDREEAD
ncbi:MAG TPA: hypothetical protein DGL70_05725 [Exiguobacterium sp.]|nr:hypothetical protein [Exiguobacterium sp.]